MASSKSQGAYGFDSSGLERAAKAAKELDKSPNARQAFELSSKQEETKQSEYSAKVKELEIRKVQVEQAEKRKTIEHELSSAQQKSKFDDQLARSRYEEQLQTHAQMQELNRKRDEDSVSRQEALRRQTIEYEQQLRTHSEEQRLLNREKAKIDRLFKTRELRHEDIRLKETERRNTLTQLWKNNLEAVGSGLRSYLSDFRNIAYLAGGLTLAFLGFQFARSTGRMATYFVESRIGKPSLIRDTSRRTSLKQYALSPLQALYTHAIVKGRLLPTSTSQREKDILEGIFINPELEMQLKTLGHSIVNRKRHYAPFRNLLLYGPPGTGKTMFARSLAQHSGMDYAIMTGGDIGPLGKDGVTGLHRIFDWASTTNKGVLLFMDEADAFLRRRTTEKISEEMRNALNALLYRTGTASHKFMLVLASNTPEQLDRAILDRVDEMIFFDKPGDKERLQIFYYYLLEYCTPTTSLRKKIDSFVKHPRTLVYKKTEIGMQGVEDSHIEKICERTRGFSGREIYKLVISWHDAAFNNENAILTPVIMERVLVDHLKQHKQREEWEISNS